MVDPNYIKNLEQLVFKAFDGLDYPGDNHIVQAKPYFDKEREAISALLRSKKWTEVNFKTLKLNYLGDISSILLFLTPSAFVYYYPSFLLISLREFELSDVTAFSSVNFFCKSQQENGNSDSFKFERVSLFSETQLKVIKLVFEYLDREYGNSFDREFAEAVVRINTMFSHTNN